MSPLEYARLGGKDRIELQQRVINAGYRGLAPAHHPDAGGSHENMTRLTRARDNLQDPMQGGGAFGAAWRAATEKARSSNRG